MHLTQTNNRLALKLILTATKASLVSSRKTSLLPHTTQLAHCPQCAVQTVTCFLQPYLHCAIIQPPCNTLAVLPNP
jgi:hypothetical protein